MVVPHLYPLNVAFYIFIQQIYALNNLNTVYTLRFFSSSNYSLFHNSNVFGSCIIHILYTVCAKIKKNSAAKRLKCVLNKMGALMSEDNIKIDFMEITRESMGWIHVPQDREQLDCFEHGHEHLSLHSAFCSLFN